MYRVLGFVIFNIIHPMALSLFVFSPYYFIRWALFNMFLYYFGEYFLFYLRVMGLPIFFHICITRLHTIFVHHKQNLVSRAKQIN